jgi:hypothetical protein
MAGGIDWFRWHHGSVSDPKFQLVAKKAGASVAEAIAVWACLLEAASQSEQRGQPGEPDFEAIDCALGMDDGKARAIYERMAERSLVAEDGRIAAWDKRQPKREDDSAADRKRKQRELESVQMRDTLLPPQSPDASRDVTPSHDRGEESRGEKNRNTSPTDLSTAKLPTCPHKAILGLYAKHLPTLPQPKPELWDGARAKNLAARWKWLLTKTRQSGERYATNEDEGLAWFDRFFAYVAKSDFLTGRDGKWSGCDLGWLVNAENFAKVVQGNYENREAA